MGWSVVELSSVPPDVEISKCHWTVTGPLVVIVTLKFVAFGPPQNPCTTAGVVTITEVTSAVGAGTTGTSDRSPNVSVTLAATQHKLPGSCGLSICHHDLSPRVPFIGTVMPTLNPPTAKNPTSGPKRQLAASDLGVTIGDVEVGLITIIGVFVGDDKVGDSVKLDIVGDSVGVPLPIGDMNKLKDVGEAGFEATGTG